MRLLELYIPAFGPFTDVGLDLSSGERGLHIVYGLNEAGKSSTLRALHALFYGFPAQSPDDFRHDYSQLRIGACVQDEDGAEQAFLRRKGIRNTLLDLHEEPLPETLLDPVFGNLPESLYRSLFGLDHEGLVRGGHEILSGGGELGESLFAAALGGGHLRQTIVRLEEEASQLFKLQGQKPAINRDVAEYKKVLKAIRETTLNPQDWRARQEKLRESRERAAQLRQTLEAERVELRRDQRLLQAVPQARQREQLRLDLDDLGTVPDLAPSFPTDREAAADRLQEARRNEAKLVAELKSITESLAELKIPDNLLEYAALVEDLNQRLGAQLKAAQDLGSLREKFSAHQANVNAILRELRPGLAPSAIPELRIEIEREKSIHALAGELEHALRRQQELQREVDEQATEVELSAARLKKEPAPPDPAALRTLLQLVPKDLDDQIQSATAQLATEEEEARARLTRLPHFAGTLAELEALPLPPPETVDRFETELSVLTSRLVATTNELETVDRDDADVAERLQQLRASGAVPSEADLEKARSRRDAGWDLVRRVWREKFSEKAKPVGTFCGEDTLDEAYENSVAEADGIADRLRREAERVATQANLEARRASNTKRRRALEKTTKLIESDRRSRFAAWNELWSGLADKESATDFVAPPPREMRSWLQDREQLLRLAASLRRQRGRLDELRQQSGAACTDLLGALKALQRDSADDAVQKSRSSRDLIAVAAGTVEELERARHSRTALESAAQAAEQDLNRGRARLAKARVESTAVQKRWSDAVLTLGLTATASPDGVRTYLTRLRSLFEEYDRAAELRARIEAIEADGKEFAAEVTELLRRTRPDLADLPPGEGIARLYADSSQAQQRAGSRAELLKARDEKEQTLADERRALASSEETLRRLCEAAECDTFTQLEECERRWKAHRELSQALREIDLQLAEATGEPLPEFLARVAKVDPVDLQARIDSRQASIASIESELSTLDQEIGRQTTEIERLDGGQTAAETNEQAQALLARLTHNTERYLRLRVASRVLALQMERYREAHQAPLMSRAGELFAQLTADSFAKLGTGFDSRDRPVLEGIRKNGDTVRVEGMSDGTRDQLFLALRLASLERHLESHAPFPLIVDDLLINFDDVRARATLRVLAEVSSRTQVIFFTHHQHLVDLARRELPPEVLQVPSFLPLEELERRRTILENAPEPPSKKRKRQRRKSQPKS